MATRKEESGETVHSLESQDTELIDESALSLDTPQDSSAADVDLSCDVRPPSTNSPKFDESGLYLCDQSLLDFSSPNASTTTACSTPHERKFLGTVIKRKIAVSSDDNMTFMKKQKLFSDDSLDSRLKNEKDTTFRLENESSAEVSSSSSDGRFHRRSDQKYAEAHSSSSSITKTNTNSSSDFVESVMVRKARSPAEFSYEKSPLRKAFSDDFNGTDNVAALKARILELEAEVRYLSHKKREDPRENVKVRGKQIFEKALCAFTYVYDETEGEVTSISLKQVLKPDLFDHKNHRLSISSGSLADQSGSGSEMVHHWIQRGPSIASHYSSSSVTSSTSSIPSQSGRPTSNKFLIPSVPELRKAWAFKSPKSCVCQCYCSTFTDYLSKQATRCITPETTLSSSSENIKPDSQDLTSVSIEHQMTYLRPNPPNVASQPTEKNGLKETSESAATEFKSRSSIYHPLSTNLPVFAKWPSNSFCYPGIIKNASEETWHTNSHLEVTFCDSTVKRILCENLFPAYLLPPGSEISYEKDDHCEPAKLISIECLLNNELVFLGETTKGVPEIINIPFEKIILSYDCFKGLKKSIPTTITPKKTPRFSISTANVTEGKRTRKTVKFEGSGSKVTSDSASGKRAKAKGKRTKPSTSTSGSDSAKTDKKRFRSQRKKTVSKAAASDENTFTPHVNFSGKSLVSRKLYSEMPSCSGTYVTGPPVLAPSGVTAEKKFSEVPQTASSTDTDSSSVQRDVNFDEINESHLDPEEVLDISLRSVKVKSSAKRNGAGTREDRVKGPIPDTPIFSGYNFVLTQSQPKVNLAEKITPQDSYSEEGSGTDFEDYYALPEVPFDPLKLKEQILSGSGRVYRYILQVPSEEYSKTILITDNIVETPNYLLAVSLRIPIFRHDLIINSCLEKKHVSVMIPHGMSMPVGRSLDNGQWVLKAFPNPLAGYTCTLSLSANRSTSNFWWHILNNAGAKVVNNPNTLRLISDFGSLLSFIVVDNWTPKDVIEQAAISNIPVVSTLWVMQTVIHGKLRPYKSYPYFTITSTSDPPSNLNS